MQKKTRNNLDNKHEEWIYSAFVAMIASRD